MKVLRMLSAILEHFAITFAKIFIYGPARSSAAIAAHQRFANFYSVL